MELLKITFEYRTDDNRVMTLELEGDDARKWEEMQKHVCQFAALRNQNPQWDRLNWIKKTESEQQP